MEDVESRTESVLVGEPNIDADYLSSDEIASGAHTPSSVDSDDSWQADCRQRRRRRSTHRLSISDLSDSERMTPERLAERGLGFPWQQEAFCTVELAPESTDRDFCLVPTPELGKKSQSEGSPSPMGGLSPAALEEHLAACAVQERLTPQTLDHPWDQPALCTVDVAPELTDVGRDFCLVPTPELGKKPPCNDSPSPGDSLTPTALQQRFAACAREVPGAMTKRELAETPKSIPREHMQQQHHTPDQLVEEQTSPHQLEQITQAPPPHKRQRARTRAGGA
mmetsp:Transcript_91885/g.168509  ORF Transcript_91885/g.168509 Transcript_91885/m.168509 type:complete len:280 (+) Transcript_91885:88-927(+)